LRFFTIIIFLLLSSISTAAFCSDCGWKTSAKPQPGNVFVSMTDRTVNFIRGRVFLPDGKTPADNIDVEVYRNFLPKDAFKEDITYSRLPVNTIISRKRITARLIQKGGRFCFRSLPAGKYLLRIGTVDDSQFSPMNVFVTLNPKIKKSSRHFLKVDLEMSL
jgi:hypothetical protein